MQLVSVMNADVRRTVNAVNDFKGSIIMSQNVLDVVKERLTMLKWYDGC